MSKIFTSRLGKLLVTLLAISLMVGILVPTSWAADDKKECDDSNKVSYNASSKQVEKINQLWGKKMSRAEFIRQVFPEAIAHIPKEAVPILERTEMQWPDPLERNENNEIYTEGYYLAQCKSRVEASGNVITYQSSNRVWLPTPWTKYPYMEVWSFCWEYFDGNPRVVSAVWNYGYNVYECVAEWKYQTDRNDKFRTSGFHFLIQPDGQTFTANTVTDWINVTPY